MTVKVGDKVRVIGDSYDFLDGDITTVVEVDDQDRKIPIAVTGGYWLHVDSFEPITEKPTEYDYAAQAAKHGIKITVSVGHGHVVFDGKN